ncbi:MAG: methionine adenosyltransferase [Candidatus Fermentibacteraceae bacterium]|nr:methionine adenosyltransferase [Candidatus Fermentibacteraceae bacterium]MBN2607544.1 methionine adenosyltransferase [Candidatus Fermentibacteraceae bacterium]
MTMFTSESVSEGHPDKICDQISDAVLDAHLKLDPDSHVACETLVTTNFCLLAGEVKSHAEVNYENVARETVKSIGYDIPDLGFHFLENTYRIRIHSQSPDIDHGVVDNEGAGDQGLMFGFACSETDALMPYPIQLAHRLLEKLRESRRAGELPWARPDAKSQVTVEYNGYQPVAIDEILLSVHHAPDAHTPDMAEDVLKKVIQPVLGGCCPSLPWNGNLLFNPSGRFAIGGPHGDAGLTGRKIIVDTYGGTGRHGGGAFSGKDPTKVDRSAAYMARHIAKNIVSAGIAERCEIQLAYAIGRSDPVSVMVETFGTEKVKDVGEVEKAVREIFPLRPYRIIEYLGLKRPIFSRTSSFGHFGREPEKEGHFSWEKTDRAEELASRLL